MEEVSQCQSLASQEKNNSSGADGDGGAEEIFDVNGVTEAIDTISSSCVDVGLSSTEDDRDSFSKQENGAIAADERKLTEEEGKNQLLPDEVSSSDSLSVSSSVTTISDSEREISKGGSPSFSANTFPPETEDKLAPSVSESEDGATKKGADERCKESISVNTEPITEVLREILRVSPSRTSTDSCSEEKSKIHKSSSCSPPAPQREPRQEQNSSTPHSIALDDPAIVTSSDVCTNNSTRPAVPCEGDGSTHIMNLLRKSMQNDLVNKGDGDSVFEKAGPEKPAEKVSVPRARTDSSTSTSTASAETGITDGETTRIEPRPVREMLVRRQASQTNMPASDKPVLETLTFGTSLDDGDGVTDEGEDDTPQRVTDRSCPCPLCERSFPSDNKEDVLAHLVLVHKFVIADVNFIGNLSV